MEERRGEDIWTSHPGPDVDHGGAEEPERCFFFSLGQKDLMVLQDLQGVLAVDALTSSHPLSSDESSIVLPEQISEQFDAISYSKVQRRASS